MELLFAPLILIALSALILVMRSRENKNGADDDNEGSKPSSATQVFALFFVILVLAAVYVALSGN